MSELILTTDQKNAYDAFRSFLLDDKDSVFVLSGYAGTGKSTLVKKLLKDLPHFLKGRKLIDPDYKDLEVRLTATTNKAAENLSSILGEDVVTIHNLLRLSVFTDYKTNKTMLSKTAGTKLITDSLVFIDEASYVDDQLLCFILDVCQNSKIVFIGDPAQLLAVNATSSPVFGAGYTEATLTQIVRQAEDNPIQELCNGFRESVIQGHFKPITVDGVAIKHLPREKFEDEIIGEFLRPNWQTKDSKVLAWTNKRVIQFNQGIRQKVQGEPELNVGDYAICNKYFRAGSKKTIKTDQQVLITAKRPDIQHDVKGWLVTLDDKYRGFLPESQADAKAAFTKARKQEKFGQAASIDNWLDLRAAYACTVNKSQGSTYDKVFIDLDDVGRCRNHDQLARMLYVSASRARNEVVLTGDIQ